MELLYLLEGIRTPFWNVVMEAATYLGEEAAYMAVLLILFWCVDKRKGYFAMFTGFMGMAACQFLKLALCVPRPFIRDPAFTIVESARAAANDYSFPSAHILNATAAYGSTARVTGRRWLKALCCMAIVLVGVSRMYLGVHTPWDVLGGLALGLGGVMAFWPLFRHMERHPVRTHLLFALTAVVAIAMVAYAELRPTPATADPAFAQGGRKNIYIMAGIALGIVAAYVLDVKWIHFSTEAPLLGQVLKCLVGMGLIMLLRSLLKAPLLALTGGHPMANGIRYFLMALFGTGIWPLTFPLWQRVGRRHK